jgi:hypothetical protein
MLADFVVSHRKEIINRCQAKVTKRSSPPPSKDEINHGVPMFLDEMLAELRLGLSPNPEISITAAKHGHDLLKQGFSQSQVVHGYGDVCQAITEMAVELKAPISSDDFRMLNRCLDDAIASAITQYGDERDAATKDRTAREGTRMRVLGEALIVSVSAAEVAFEAIQSGSVGTGGSTGMVLARSLKEIANLSQRIQLEMAAIAKP